MFLTGKQTNKYICICVVCEYAYAYMYVYVYVSIYRWINSQQEERCIKEN